MSMTAPAADADLSHWLAYLETLNPNKIDMGLDRVRTVAERLHLQLDCVRFTVAGTNGKGSTCAMLDAVLRSAGYRVGMYTSPHLLRFNERIRIDGSEVSDADIVAQLVRIESVRDGVPLTYFEMTTLAAFLLFAEARLDAAVLEVGLGGRLDAVNLLDADCAIITSVDYDHMEYLGNTRESIALEQAHIFRPGRPAICSDPMPPETIMSHADAIGARLWRFGVDYNYSGDRQQWAYGGRTSRRAALPYPALRGANQLLNASAVLAALEALHDRLPISQQAVREGMLHVSLPGRVQIVPGVPHIILDVAHNPHAAAALGQSLDAMGHYPHTYAVVGMMHDKDMQHTLEKMARRIDRWMLCSLPSPRGASADDLEGLVKGLMGGADNTPVDPMVEQAEEVTRTKKPAGGHRPGVRPMARAAVPSHDVTISKFADPAQAFAKAQELATDNDRIIVFGSFATVGPVLKALQDEGRDLDAFIGRGR